jgi:hypothetical protein
MAKKQYWAYTSALSSVSRAATTVMYGNEYEQATKSAASAYSSASSQAGKSASSASAQASRNGNSGYTRAADSAYSIASEASATISSAAAAASNSAVRAFDENRDYVYSGYNSTTENTLLTCVSHRHMG